MEQKTKKNAILRLAVPDFEEAVMWYVKNKKIVEILGLVSGGQKTQYDYHKMIFDKNYLTYILKKCGFDNVVEWDWRKTDHSNYDDYSQSYFPHLDKDNGTLMSLNLEAQKISDPPEDEQYLGKSPWSNVN